MLQEGRSEREDGQLVAHAAVISTAEIHANEVVLIAASSLSLPLVRI
jgi:hypothetical protein